MELASILFNVETINKRPRAGTKLIDVNIDCIEEIFKHLGLQDLLNIADACKRLRKASFFIFASTHQPKIYIDYTCKEIDFWTWSPYYLRTRSFPNGKKTLEIKPDEEQELGTLKTCLQLLRCFGNHITFLDIRNYNRPDVPIFDRILSHVNEFSSESLKELTIHGDCLQGALNQLKKPFLNVEQVVTNACTLKTNLWNTFFPHLQTLKYGRFGTEKDKNKIPEYVPSFSIDNKFPHLKSLTVHSRRRDFECEETLYGQICTAYA